MFDWKKMRGKTSEFMGAGDITGMRGKEINSRNVSTGRRGKKLKL